MISATTKPFFILALAPLGVVSAAAVPAASSVPSCAVLEDASKGNSSPQDSIILDVFKQYKLPYNDLGATAYAFMYGYPAKSYADLIFSNDTNKLHTTGGTDTSNTGAPASNAVTVYQKASLDLSQDNLVLTIPPFQPDRYYSFEYFDVWQGEYATIGVVDNDKPGDYLLRPALNTGKAGLTTDDCDSQYAGCIDAPGYDSRLLNRVELKNASDAKYVDQYYSEVKLTKVARTGSAPGQPLEPSQFENLSNSTTVDVLQLTAILASRNPPQNVDFAASLPKVLSCAGINVTNETYTPVPGVNISQAENLANATLTSYFEAPGTLQNLGNGWTMFNTTLIGGWGNGTDILLRAAATTAGNLWNVAPQAIYPFPVNHTYYLPDTEGLLLTFNGKPTIDDFGFWSLTAYNANGGGFVANPENIFDITNLGNLTYPDGQLVYSTNGTSKPASTPFQVLVQGQDVPPPANWTGNWLPGPKQGGGVKLTLRFYAPEPASSNGQYHYPDIKQIAAIQG